jgi:hypothetical protein
VLVIKVNSRIYVSKELQIDSTQVAIPVCCRRHTTDTLPTPSRKKSSDLDELQAPQFCSGGAEAPSSSPLSCATASEVLGTAPVLQFIWLQVHTKMCIQMPTVLHAAYVPYYVLNVVLTNLKLVSLALH